MKTTAERKVPIRSAKLGQMLTAIGQAVDCPICLKAGLYHSGLDQRRRQRRMYRRRRRYW